MSLDQDEIAEMRRWCKAQDPGSEDAEAAIMRLAERPQADAEGLWEMIEIVLTIDGKVTKGEKAAAAELAGYISQAFEAGERLGINPLPTRIAESCYSAPDTSRPAGSRREYRQCPKFHDGTAGIPSTEPE